MPDVKPLTEAELEARRKANAAATEEAHKMAQAHIDEDKRMGRPSSVQERNEFELRVIQEGLKAQIEKKFPANGGGESTS